MVMITAFAPGHTDKHASRPVRPPLVHTPRLPPPPPPHTPSRTHPTRRQKRAQSQKRIHTQPTLPSISWVLTEAAARLPAYHPLHVPLPRPSAAESLAPAPAPEVHVHMSANANADADPRVLPPLAYAMSAALRQGNARRMRALRAEERARAVDALFA